MNLSFLVIYIHAQSFKSTPSPLPKTASRLERRDSDGNDLSVAVRDANSGVLDARLVGSGLGVAVENDGGGAGLSIDDLDVLERSASALALDLQALEDGFLGAPAAGERGLGVGLGAAVGDLLLGEVALDEGVVVDVEGVDALDRKSTRLNSSHSGESRMPSSA